MSEEVNKVETPEEDNSSALGGVVDFAGLVSALTESAEEVDTDALKLLTGEVNEEKPEGAIVTPEGQNADEVKSLEPLQAEAVEGVEGENPAEGEPDEKGKLPPAVQARIDEITREKYEARDQAEKLKAENAELKAKLEKAPAPQVNSENPLSDVHSPEELSSKEKEWTDVRHWAMQHLVDGGNIPTKNEKGETEQTYIPPEKVREWLVKSDKVLLQDIPARKVYLANAGEFSQKAKEAYPEMFTNGTQEGQWAAQFSQIFPELKRMPDWQITIGDYIAGLKMRISKEKAAAAPASATKPVVAPQKAAVGANRVSPGATGNKVSASSKNIGKVLLENDSLDLDQTASLLSDMFG
jgi:hypothetical protein